MNRDEVIALAKEAQQDHEVRWSEADVQTVAFFLSFAALVAAKEREACAQVCEGEANRLFAMDCHDHSDLADASLNCAAAIRARGQS